MSGPQPPPTRPWFRLASMVRPADPRPPAVPPPSTTTSAPPPSPKKPPASPTSAKADIPKDSTTNTPPPADPRSPVVAARSPKTVMSPGVPRLPTGVPQTTTSTEGSNFIESSSTSAPTPLLPPLPVPSQKLTLPAVADQETKIMDRTGTSSIPTPPPIPPQSPYKPKSSMAPPPSPLLLPPPQISPMNNEPRMIPPEAEQKAVLVKEETIPATTPATYPASARQTSSLQHLVNNNAAARRTNGAATAAHPHPDNYKEGEAEKRITTINKQSPKLNNKKKLESDQEVGMKVITIAGENRGAIMELVRSPPPRPASGKSVSRHNNKLVMSENERESSSSGKEAGIGQYSMSSKEKSNSSSASIPMTAFMNSNVQGVNNSILFNAQCTHQNPGVHVSLSRKPSSNIKSKVHNVKGTHSDKN